MGIFEKHNIERFYETSDGFKFFIEADAIHHSKSLIEKTVKTVCKEDGLVIEKEEKIIPKKHK